MTETAWPGSQSFEQGELFIMAAVGEVGGGGSLGTLGPAGSPNATLPAGSKPLAPLPAWPMHHLPVTPATPGLPVASPPPQGGDSFPSFTQSSLYPGGPPVITSSPLPHQYLFVCKGSGPPSPPPGSLP